jgi:hypothetical protein
MSNGVRGTQGESGIMMARRFIQSLAFPRNAGDGIEDGAPPRVLFYWPNFLSLSATVDSQEWVYQLFSSDGTPRRFTVSLELKEIRDVRITSSQVLRDQRNSTPPDDNNIIRIA